MSSKIRIGFVGSGAIAGVHRKLLSADSRVEITGVYDVSAERAGGFGAPVFDSVESLLGAVDAVYITSPNRMHPEQALKGVAAGKHVFCEKPMAVTREDADRMEEASARSGKVFQVGKNRRFAPVYQKVKQAIAATPALSADFKMNRGELQNPPWTKDDSFTGGYLFETPIHIFDMARFLMGEIVEVTARAESLVYPCQDTFFALFRFASGRTATFRSVAYTTWQIPFERVEVYGEHATFATEECDRVMLTHGLGAGTEIHDYRHLPWEQRWGYDVEDRLFVDAIEKGTAPPVTANDGAQAVRIALAIYESGRTGRPVEI